MIARATGLRRLLMDFEFHQPAGERMEVICGVIRDADTGETVSFWVYGEGEVPPPHLLLDDYVLVAHLASAECQALMALGWPMPDEVIDTYAEFRVRTNGDPHVTGNGLLDALAYFGLPVRRGEDKEAMRALAIRGGDFTEQERAALMAYCLEDVEDLGCLYALLLPHLDGGRTLLRGRYMLELAKVEEAGLPVDAEAIRLIQKHQGYIRTRAIERLDTFGIYRGGKFSHARYEEVLASLGVDCPRTATGRAKADRTTLSELSRSHPALIPLKELRHLMSQARLADFPLGPP